MNKRPTRLFDRFGHFGVLITFAVALAAFIIAPLEALRWSKLPFPGFMVEQTLVVSNTGGSGWVGLAAGMHYPMRVVQIGGISVQTERDFDHFIRIATYGQALSVLVTTGDGEIREFSPLILSRFPTPDLLRLFWLPYWIGLLYLALGLWVYWLRGNGPAGRAFAYFAACAALVNALTFDIWTTHTGTVVWTFAVASVGGAVIGLAVLFPTGLLTDKQRGWVRGLAYGVSLALAVWGLVTIYNLRRPLDYVMPWQFSYLYGAVGIAVFIISMLFRLRMPVSPIERQNVRIILWAGVLAFTPVGVWFAIQLFINVPFNPLILSPLLLIFPVSIAVAMIRYHLWDFDLVVRRTIVYTTLTGILILIYFVLVLSLDRLSDRYFGNNNFFNVIATIVIVLIFAPLRRLVQQVVDRRLYRRAYQAEARLAKFSNRLRSQVDLDQITDEVIQAARETVGTESVGLWILKKNNGGDHV
jgi:hypothetical protein